MALFRKPRSPYWWYDIRLPGGDRKRGSTGETTKSAAKTYEANKTAELLSAKPDPAARSSQMPTVREFSERFLQWSDNSHSLEAASKRFYRYGVRLLNFTPLSDLPMNKVTSELVECTRFVRPVFDRRLRVTTSELVACSATYVNQALRTLKAMFGKALDWEVLHKRPRVKPLKAPGRRRMIDTDAEIKLQHQFEAETNQGRHNRMRLQAWLVTVILQDSGMRPDEVFPMRVENLNFADRHVWVPEGKTENASRFVGMSERMYSLLKDWVGNRTEGWVFPSKRAKSGHLQSIAVGFRAARRRAGLDETIVPYSARHTYATYTMAATKNTFAVSRAMGHADIKSMAPYQHPETAELNNAINKRNRAREERRFELLTSGHTFGHTTEVVQ